MRAVIFAPGDWPGVAPLNVRHPAPLLPLVDRPFIQHVVEYLVHQGVTKFDLVLCHHPEKIEHFLGDGQRWGCHFIYHLARDPDRPYRLLRTMTFQENEPFLLGHGDRLPLLALKDAASPSLYCSHRGEPTNGADQRDWTGWALLRPEHVVSLAPDVDEDGLRSHLEAAGAEVRDVPRPLSMRTFDEILAAHEAVLGKQFEGLMLTGREVEPGIWLSRNVVLHPTAEVTAPVYIGENCEIGAGVKLGPRAVLGHGCVLDTHSTVTNSLILPGSYVGEGLELADVIVDKNRLVNVRFGAAVTITDNFILGSLTDHHGVQLAMRIFGRAMAAIGLLLLGPVLIGTAVYLKARRHGAVLHRREVVHLPAGPEATSWETYSLWSFLPPEEMSAHANGTLTPSKRDFLLRVLPGLTSVVRGQLSLVGVPSRTAKEIQALPHDWQTLYLKGKAGLITESAVYCDAAAGEEERYAAETFYVASAGWRHDLRVLTGYLAQAFFPFLYPTRSEEITVEPEEVSV